MEINISSLVFQLFIPFILFISMAFTWLRDRKSTRIPLPPGPKPWPIVGCLPAMLVNKPVFRWIHNVMKELGTEIACFRIGNVHVIPVTCPNISRQFLKAQDSVFATRPSVMSGEIASSGYLTIVPVPDGEQWKKMKGVLVSELLSPVKQKLFYGKRLKEANHLLRYVYDQCSKSEDGGLVNIRFASRHYCANLIKNILFNRRSFGEGKKDGGPSFEDEEHLDSTFAMLAYLYAFSVSDYFPCLKLLDLDCHGKIMKEAIRIMSKYQNPIIEERFQQWRIIGKNKQVEDLLDMFITLKDANGNPLLSKEEIQAQITELMIEVVDNPSNAVEWGLAEMINQPKILTKAVEELDRVVGKERLVEESDFSQLNYIKACAREALRLHPMAPFNIPHVAMVDTIVGNYFIPKISHVLLSRVGLGRNPKVWDEPEKFKLERHLKNIEGRSQVTLTEPDLRFITFTTGKRRCPGIEMGTLITVMLFARFLQGFSWSIPSTQTSIDLTESTNSLALANPLVALALPRLPPYLYPTA